METKTKILLSIGATLVAATIIQYKRYSDCVAAIKKSDFNSTAPYTSCYDTILKKGKIDYDAATGIYKVNVNKFPFYGLLTLKKDAKGTTVTEKMQLLREVK